MATVPSDLIPLDGEGTIRDGSTTAGLDALLPPAMAEKAEEIGIGKVHMSPMRTFVLAVLAGAFIGLGAMFATIVGAGATGHMPFGVARLLSGLAFCLGLILVVIAGAELFTGNNLIVMAWADRRVTLSSLLRNWGIVYAGNLVGGVATVLLVLLSGQYKFGGGAVGVNALTIAQTKTSWDLGRPSRSGSSATRWYAWRSGSPTVRGRSPTRFWRSYSRSPLSSPQASSTPSPTCTS